MIWDWSYVGGLIQSPRLLHGAWTTLWIAVVSQTAGTILGLIFAQMQLSRNVMLQAIAAFYSWIWRGTPLLVQILFSFAVLPRLVGFQIGVIESGLLALGLNEGARMAEVIRAGLLSIDRGQIEAGKSLGMSGLQTYRLVVLPQAIRIIIPPLGNNFSQLLKATSLLAVIGVGELLRVSREIANVSVRPLEVFSVASVYYLAMLTLWDRVQVALEKRFEIPSGTA
jgi:polar amino acid transport system permease protein